MATFGSHQGSADLLDWVRSIDTHWDQSTHLFEGSVVLDALMAGKLTRINARRTGWRTLIPEDRYFAQILAQPFKRYEGVERIDFKPHMSGRRDAFRTKVPDLFLRRKSTKKYKASNLGLGTLGRLLHFSYGVTRVEHLHGGTVPWRFRPIPSPGGLFASEVYVVAVNADVLSGLYHYRPDINALEVVDRTVDASFLRESCGLDNHIDDASSIGVAVITTSIVERLFLKYADRAIKFILMEAGILGQQITLVAESMGLGSCMLGGYFDDEVNEVLGVDGVLESVQNVMVVGVPK